MNGKDKLIFAIFNFINLIVLAIIIFKPTFWKTFFFLTTLSFYSNCLYFFTTTYIKYKQNSDKGYKEETLHFLQNNYFKISSTFSIFVVVCYWSLYLLGSKFMKTPSTLLGHIITIFLHGGELCFIAYDFCSTIRDYTPFNKRDLKALTYLFLIYTFLDIIAGGLLNYYPYAFMVNLSVAQLVFVYFVLYLVLINCYFLYQYALRARHETVVEMF
jgi:hypothetical protein